MKPFTHTVVRTAVVVSLGSTAVLAHADGQTPLPPMKVLDQRGEINFIQYDSLQSVGGVSEFKEPAWVTENYVDTGKLPPLAERIPENPLVFNNDVFKDGVGNYGGVFRHVIGGRPQGWNWNAGLHQGWGGINYTVQECLTRTGPMYQLDQSRVEPLPNLATSWEWSDDGKSLTLNLIEGARWSDGDPFDADDVMFDWENNISDPNVPSTIRGEALGEGTTLEKMGDYQVKFTFTSERPILNLYTLAYQNFCPGPSHILSPLHPKNSDNTYEQYINALAPEAMPVVTMGAWVPVQYKADELVVMRRNPYYWKVDKEGHQLPYMDEMHFKLSTWEDRTIQALAGTGDFSNMETPSIYLEALKRSRDADFPARLSFGPRSYTWRIDMNFAKGKGVSGDRDMAIRDLNRDLRFRQAVSHTLDRDAMGQSLVRGPFTAPHAGGFAPESVWFDIDNISYYGLDVERSSSLLADIGFEDSDGDGILNWTDGALKGENLSISLKYSTTSEVFPVLADSIISMMADVGIEVIASPSTDDSQVMVEGADFDWALQRGRREYVTPTSGYTSLAAVSPNALWWHYYEDGTEPELEPFEQTLIDTVNQFASAQTSEEQVTLMHEYNRIFTENVYHVGLVSAPGALVINKRVKNLSEGVPILQYQWAEDAVIREMFYIPEGDQLDAELLPGKLPEY